MKKKSYHIGTMVLCALMTFGMLGCGTNTAETEKNFVDLQGVGVFVAENAEEVFYEVWIDDPVQEKDGVRVELRDFYGKGKQIYGTVRITGENLLDMTVERTLEEEETALDEKFLITWHYGAESRKMYSSSGGRITGDDGMLKVYEQDCEEWNYLEKGIDTYYLEVSGFDRMFMLKLVEPKTVETPEGIGYSVTKNDTTVTARAAIVDDMIEVEYFMFPSSEVKMAQEHQYKTYVLNWPYQYNQEEQTYTKNADGEEMPREKFRNIVNGQKFWYKGTEEDFPLTFHRPTLTGTNEESHMVEILLPKKGGKLTENLPKVEFDYGTVEILSVASEEIRYDTGNAEGLEYVPALQVDLIYQVTPKEGTRQMYNADFDVENGSYGRRGLDTGSDDYSIKGWSIYLEDTESKTLTAKFHMPSFWIVGDYDIVIEEPVSRENNASAIDEESNVKDEYFNIG